MKKIILFTTLLIGLGANALILSNMDFYYIRAIISCLFLLVSPGLLTLLALRIKTESLSEFIIYTIGVSIALLMLIGLMVNSIAPLFGINNPLSATPILTAIDAFVLPIWTYLFFQRKRIVAPVTNMQLKPQALSMVLGYIPVVFPVLAILGALSINNGRSNMLTMTMLGFIGAYVLLITFLRNKLQSFVFPLAVFMMSFSLLLMTSLRGWYITGHDIYLEYYIFQITKLHDFWKMAYFQDPYNACLSITILPTMISNLTHIQDAYIFKALYQMIFSFSMVGVYLFLKRYTKSFIAFLAVFCTITFPTFMTDMPMLNRQEIGMLFFILLLLLVVNKSMSSKVKWSLFSIFGLGLVISHYATAYLTASFFTLTAISHILLTVFRFNPKMKELSKYINSKLGLSEGRPWVKLGVSVLLLAGTFIWYGSFTKTSQGLEKTITKIEKSINSTTFGKAKSDGPANYSLLKTKQPDKQTLLDNYENQQEKYVRQFNDNSAFLNQEVYKKFKLINVDQEVMPLTSFGEALKKYVSVFKLNDVVKQVYAKTVQVMIVFGLVSIFILRKYLSKLDEEYVILCVTFLLLIIGETVFSSSAIDYGILRLIQQGLFILSLPLVIGLLALFRVLNKLIKNVNIYLSSTLLVLFFLFLSGFIPQLTGGYYAQLNLNNSGFYYDAYFLHKSDLQSIEWISKNHTSKLPIQADWFAGKKIHTFSNISSVDGLTPSEIRKNSYVYLDKLNVVNKKVIVYVGGIPIYYQSPINLLNENKSLIYNNGGSRIYK